MQKEESLFQAYDFDFIEKYNKNRSLIYKPATDFSF